VLLRTYDSENHQMEGRKTFVTYPQYFYLHSRILSLPFQKFVHLLCCCQWMHVKKIWCWSANRSNGCKAETQATYTQNNHFKRLRFLESKL